MARLTDRSYWDAVWTSAGLPTVDAARNPHQARLDRLFRRHLRGAQRRFVEVGAGGSAWPAHVARHHGAEAWGIDISHPGLEAARRAAQKAHVRPRLIEADLMDRAALPAGQFDVVYSGGFVEHFQGTAADDVMRRLAELLAPSGVVITTVPNLRGVNGWLQRWADPDCYHRHVVFTPASLDEAHGAGGLVPLEPSRYAGALDLASVNLQRRVGDWPRPALALLWRTLALGRSIAERAVHDGNELLSPAIVGTYQKSGGGGGREGEA